MNASYWNETRVGRSLRRGLLFVCFLIGPHVGCNVAEQLACEEAAARLTERCPGFNPEDVYCSSSPFNNDNDISEAEAPCIIYQECVDLVAYGICDTIYHVKPGFMVEARVNRMHLGGGAQLGFMGINRVTTTKSLTSLTFGLCANVSLDLYQWSKASAWTIDASGLIDVLGISNDGMLGATLGMGVRL